MYLCNPFVGYDFLHVWLPIGLKAIPSDDFNCFDFNVNIFIGSQKSTRSCSILFQLIGPADHDPGSCDLNRLIVLTINSASNRLDGKNTAKHEQQQTVREAPKKKTGWAVPSSLKRWLQLSRWIETKPAEPFLEQFSC